MLFTISDSPKHANYHADQNYLDGIGLLGSEVIYINIDTKSLSLPLIKKYAVDEYYDLYCPIGFQASLGKIFWTNILDPLINELYEKKALSLYLLIKDNIESQVPYINSAQYRTNYYFNLGETVEILLTNQKRDCRQRVKKVMKEIDYKLCLDSTLSEFENNYIRIANQNEFNSSYRFNINDFKKMFNANDTVYLELISDEGIFLSGGFFGTYGNEVDYLFGANSILYNDTIRLLIWEAVKYFKINNYKTLYLGGGIHENDSLSIFKKRFGTNEKKCSVVKSIINKKMAESLMNDRMHDSWFVGYFPPYRSKI